MIVGPVDSDKADAIDEALIRRARDQGGVFVGQRTDMPECYAAMDVFVTASWREGFPRAAMEAAAMALPTVATDIRGNRQVIADGESGVLVPVRHAVALAAAIAGLVDDDDRRAEMASNARTSALDHFDQATQVRITLAAYRDE